MSRVVIIVKNAQVLFGPAPSSGDVYDIDPLTLDDYGCQVTEARITAAANAKDIPATYCEPGSQINAPSSFTLELNGLQDWGRGDTDPSFSEYLFVNDATTVAFAMYLEGSTNPSAMALVSLAAGDFGGVAGEPLVLTGSFPIQGYPNVLDKLGAPLRAAPTGAMAASSTGTDVPDGEGVAAGPDSGDVA